MSSSSGNQNRNYFLGGYDITGYIIQQTLPQAVQSKPEWGEIVEIPRLEIEVFSGNGEFNRSELNSFTHGADIGTLPLRIVFTQGNVIYTEWSGFVENILEDFENYKCTIIGVSPFARQLDSTALVTTGPQTPAELSRRLFVLFNIPVNESSYALADSLHENLIAADFDPNLLDSAITLMEAQKLLAAAGYGRIYTVNNQMHYEVFTQSDPVALIEIHEWHLMTHPKISNEERQGSSYVVQSIFGEAQSFGWSAGDGSKTLDFGPNSPVKVTSITAAQTIADKWETIDRLQQRHYEFALLHDYASILDLTSIVSFNWESKNILNESLEIVSIDRSDPKYVVLTGRTI